MPGQTSQGAREARLEKFIALMSANPTRNQTDAAIEAGFPPKSAKVRACHLMKRGDVRAAIDKAREEQLVRIRFEGDEVIRELVKIARASQRDVRDVEGQLLKWADIPTDVRDAMREVRVESKGPKKGYVTSFAFYSKAEALTLLGQHFKLFVNRLAHEDPSGKPLGAGAVELAKVMGKLSDAQLAKFVEKLV